jgi:hypothetical protein
MNKNHYVSLSWAKKLKEAGIEFPESEKVWIKEEILGQGIHPFRLTTRLEKEQIINTPIGEFTIIKLCLSAPSLSELLDELPSPLKLSRTLGQVPKDYFLKLNFFHTTVRTIFKYRLFYSRPGHSPCHDFDVTADTAPDAAVKILIKLRAETKE